MLTYVVYDYGNREYSVPRNNFAIIDVSDEDNYTYAGYLGSSDLEDASFAKVYSKDTNEGYSKEVIKSGEYICAMIMQNFNL